MKTPNNSNNTTFELDDYYLAQSRAYVEIFLAGLGLSHEMLLLLPKDQSSQILKQALEFAAAQITRKEAMIRLGQKDVDTKMDNRPKRHIDRLDRRFYQPPK